MHKGVILLVRADDRDEAVGKAHDFMEGYQNEVWDWYQIGGRWNNQLAPKDKLKKWNAMAEAILRVDGKDYISQQSVDENQDKLQEYWELLGLEGQNPYCNHYNLGDDGNSYDAVRLIDCLETVREWLQDVEEESEQILKESKERYKEDKHMQGYMMRKAGTILAEYFSFDTNVYNIEEENYRLPKDIVNFYAVMIDMHN